MNEELIDACVNFTSPFEGSVSWMYRDSSPAGNITVGTGHLLYSAAYAAQVFGVDISVLQPQWDALQDAPAGKVASFYESLTTLRLTPDQITALFRSDLDCRIASCQKKVPEFDSLPAIVAVVVVDIEFNTGNVASFTHFLNDLSAKNWQQAAVDCHRKETPQPGGVQPERNRQSSAMILASLMLTAIPGSVT